MADFGGIGGDPFPDFEFPVPQLGGGGGGGGDAAPVADPGFTPGGQGVSLNPADFSLDPSRVSTTLDRGSPPDGGDSPWNKFSSGLMNEIAQSPLKGFSTLLGLGGTGFNIANQIRASGQLATAEKGVAAATKQAQAAAAPAVAAGTQDINRAQAGKLQPAMEAGIQDWLQKAVADIKGRFASMGLGNSTQEQSAVQQAQLQAQEMRGKLLQSEEQIGGQLVGTGVNAAIGGGQLSAHQQQLLSQIIAGGNQWLGQLTGRQA